MKRSSLKPGTKSLKRTAFKRKSPMPCTGLLSVQVHQRQAPQRKAAMKTSRPKMTPIRRAARGQDCTLNFDGICNHAFETTVLCHSNYLSDGRGMGLKAPDTAAAFGCSACHDLLDGRRPRPAGLSLEDVERTFRTGVQRTHAILKRMGLLTIEESETATGCHR